MQNQTVVENTVEDMSFLDDLDDLLDIEALESHQEIIDDAEEDLLLSAVNEVEDEYELSEMYAAQEVSADFIEVPATMMVDGSGVAILAAESSAALGVKAAAKVHKSRATTPSARILSRLGAEAAEYATLTTDCATKTDEDLIADISKTVDAMAMYVSDKAVDLFKFLKTGGGLNAVTERGFKVLLKDGVITGGTSGNLYQNLLTKPYSHGTAASQSSQIIQLFTDLKIGTRVGSGSVTLNPDSVILDRVKTRLGV